MHIDGRENGKALLAEMVVDGWGYRGGGEVVMGEGEGIAGYDVAKKTRDPHNESLDESMISMISMLRVIVLSD